MAKPPASAVDPNSDTYPDADTAVRAALKAFGIGKDHEAAEKACVIVKQPDGSYAYSTPVSQERHDAFTLRAQLLKGQSIAAIVHTHPGDDEDGQVFSQRDLDVARQLNVPSYVNFLKDDSLRRFAPGQTKTLGMKVQGFRQEVSRGDPVTLGLGQQPAALLGNPPQTSAVLGSAPAD